MKNWTELMHCAEHATLSNVRVNVRNDRVRPTSVRDNVQVEPHDIQGKDRVRSGDVQVSDRVRQPDMAVMSV